MLAIQLLGSPQILRHGQALTLPRRKSRALLYYLAAHTTPLERDHILTLLWPELDRAAAQQTLRSSLYGLRKALGDTLLSSDSRIGLAPQVDVDLHRFETVSYTHLDVYKRQHQL